MDITLYYAPVTCSMVPWITLTEAGADFEARPVNMRKRENKAPDYLRINPKHKVPALVVDGRTLTENVAIQQWIARAFPKAKLLPTDAWQELQAVSLMAWFASGIHPHLSRINSPAKYCGADGSEDSVTHLAWGLLFEEYGLADGMLAGRDFFFDHFTAADAYFFWCYRRATQFGIDRGRFTNCDAHFERMKTWPSVARLLAFEAEVQEKFKAVA